MISISPDKTMDTAVSTSYERLVQVLNHVRRACPTLPVLSIIWMHPKHPIQPVQELLMDRGTAAPAAGTLKRMASSNSPLLRFAVCAANAMRLSLKLALLRAREREKIDVVCRKPFDLVAKTWCFGLQRPSGDNDFYYGDLQQRLAGIGIRMLLLCGDTNDGDWHAFADGILASNNSARVPELCLASPWSPFRMLWLQLQSARTLRHIAARATDPLVGRVARLASLDVFSPSVTQTGLFFWIGQEVVRTWKPRAVVTLYEGHGWEKCLWWGIKTEAPACKTVGYQHTVVFPEALGLIRPSVDIRERSVPDVVLALGEPTRDLLRKAHEDHNSRVIPFGTFRYQGRLVGAVAPAARRCVLVIPEGLPFEIKTLFQFAFACARLMPSHTFVLRCHPNSPIADALSELGLNLRDLPNVIASENRDIQEDFARSSLVLYRGSSAVLYAVLAGLFPIYLHTEEKFDSDPLYTLASWRGFCTTPEQFAELVVRYETLPATEREAEWHEAASYVSRYTVPVTEQSIKDFLAEIRS